MTVYHIDLYKQHHSSVKKLFYQCKEVLVKKKKSLIKKTKGRKFQLVDKFL